MKIYTTAIRLFDETGEEKILPYDTIGYAGEFWIVPYWREIEPGGPEVPVRLICISSLPHAAHIGSSVGDFVLQFPLTTKILDGKLNEHEKKLIRVVEAPTLADIQDGQVEH